MLVIDCCIKINNKIRRPLIIWIIKYFKALSEFMFDLILSIIGVTMISLISKITQIITKWLITSLEMEIKNIEIIAQGIQIKARGDHI